VGKVHIQRERASYPPKIALNAYQDHSVQELEFKVSAFAPYACLEHIKPTRRPLDAWPVQKAHTWAAAELLSLVSVHIVQMGLPPSLQILPL